MHAQTLILVNLIVVIFSFFGHNSAPRGLIGTRVGGFFLSTSRIFLNPPGPPKNVENSKYHVFNFLAVSEGPGLFKKVGETPGFHFHLVSSKSEIVGPSYDKKTENFHEY